ncbi:MAG: hypothetical protein R3A79_22300 [Nannocystaceae bacterium]
MTSANERTERRLVISESTQSAIAQLLAVESWLASGGKRGTLVPPTRDYAVELAAVAAAEEAIDGRLSDEALALFAAGSEFLAERYGIRLGMVGAHTEDAHGSGVPKSLLAIGIDRGAFLCLPASPALGERPRLVIASNGGTSLRREPLERWLLDRVDEALDDLELSEADQRRLDGDDVLQRFIPELVAGAETPAAENQARRVKHVKFGAGSVVREVLGGPELKLEIDFDSGEKRVLLARFVTE